MAVSNPLVLEPLESRFVPSTIPYHDAPIVPQIDATMQDNLRAIFLRGQQLGNRANVFAKVGDSITFGASYLTAVGSAGYDPALRYFSGDHTDLAPTIEFFRSTAVDGKGSNSFNHQSYAARGGWTSTDVLFALYNTAPNPPEWPPESPLEGEYRVLKPSISLIMIGTNDIWRANPVYFRSQLTTIVQKTMDEGIIPVLSTIPDVLLEANRAWPLVNDVNKVITDVAETFNIPLWNYWLAGQLQANKGLGRGGVHPSCPDEGKYDPSTDPCSYHPENTQFFTDDGLEYGFNMRNFTAVEVLHKLKQVVIDGGPADATREPIFSAFDQRYVIKLYEEALGRPATTSDVEYWARFLHGRVPAIQVARAIWDSGERLQRTVTGYYQTYLDHDPDAAGLRYWVDQLYFRQATPQQVVTAFLLSPEYAAAHQEAQSFVAGLYEDLLKREGSEEELRYWTRLLTEFGHSREEVVAAWWQSAGLHHSMLSAYFDEFLGREMGALDEQAWQGVLGSGPFDRDRIVLAILASPEFSARP